MIQTYEDIAVKVEKCAHRDVWERQPNSCKKNNYLQVIYLGISNHHLDNVVNVVTESYETL
jgi:hypothetical protein